MSNIYEKIKAASALKANAALIQGAADSAKKFKSFKSDENAPKQTYQSTTTPQEEVDPTDPDEVVETDTTTNPDDDVETDATTPPAKIISALKYGRSPAKETDPKKSITTSMGKGFVKGEFGDVTEVKTNEPGSGGYEGPTVSMDEGFKTWQSRGNTGSREDFEKEAADWWKNQRAKPGKEKKTYSVTPNETEVTETTPGTRSNYNMSWKKALSAKMSERLQARDAKQDMNKYNRDAKNFEKGSFFGLGKKGKNKINPVTGKKFDNATEYADYMAGRAHDRDADGNMEQGKEYNQALNSTKGRDTESTSTTKKEKEKYDETKHGDKKSITYSDSETTKPTETAKVTQEENSSEEENSSNKYRSPNKFGLKKKSSALKNFKYKK